MACSKYTLTNTGTTAVNFNYRRCDDSMWEYQVNLNPNETKNIWVINGTYQVAQAFESNISFTNDGLYPLTPTPTPSSTVTPTPTSSTTPTPTPTPTSTVTPTPTSTLTPTPTVTPTTTVTPTVTTTSTVTPTVTSTNTPTPSITPTSTPQVVYTYSSLNSDLSSSNVACAGPTYPGSWYSPDSPTFAGLQVGNAIYNDPNLISQTGTIYLSNGSLYIYVVSGFVSTPPTPC